MFRIYALILALSPAVCLAYQTTDDCQLAEVSQQWLETQEHRLSDDQSSRLAIHRTGLCILVADGSIELEEARSRWGKILTDALLELVRDEQRKRALLGFFGTF